MMHTVSLPDPAILPLGRRLPDEDKTYLRWSGSGIRFSIRCTTLEADLTWEGSGFNPWIGVTVDGAPVCRFPLMPGTRRYPLLAGMDGTRAHEIAVVRDSQPVEGSDAGPIAIEAVHTDGEPSLPADRTVLIEFLGDSLTVGEGCLGPQSADEWRMTWISCLSAFPALVSEKLNADMRMIALGGWGASRSWDNVPENRIGRIYPFLCAPIPCGSVPADPAERPADAVVINLGTNDGSAILRMSGDERDAAEEKLFDDACALIRSVRERNPGAAVLWAYGLCGKPMEPILKKAVDAVRSEGLERVDYLSLTPAASLGSRFHPSRDAHRLAAEEIAEKLEAMLAAGK